jgi:PAS domain S-box-containing protein
MSTVRGKVQHVFACDEGERIVATILIIDDQPTFREYLVTLLGYRDHRLLQAADGAEGLAFVRVAHPDLVIADILMPTTDGYEFVRQLRAEPAVAIPPVIFFTAHYHEQEARDLAEACGVSHVLTKPCEPDVVLRTVDAALDVSAAPAFVDPAVKFEHDQLRLLAEKLSRKAKELRLVSERLTPLIDFGLDLGPEHDTGQLLQRFCHGAREVIGARHAMVGVVIGDGSRLRHCATSGIDPATAARLESLDPKQSVLGTVLNERRSRRVGNPGGDPGGLGFEPGFPRFQTLLGAPIVSPTRVFGWLCLLDKLGAEEFLPEDERLAGIVAAQLGRIYENFNLYADVLRHTAELEREVSERQRVEDELHTLNAALENAVEGIARVDVRGRYLSVNRAYAAMLGYKPQELVGMDWQLTVHPRHRDRLKATHHRMMNEGRGEDEVLGVRRDRSVFWQQIVLVKAQSQHVPWKGHYCFMRKISKRKQTEHALEQYANRLRALSRRLVVVQEEERRHLARELHDEFGQVLATITLHLHAAKKLAGEAALPRLEECAALLQQAGEQVRGLALELRPIMLDTLGLDATLRWLAEHHQQRTGCEVQFVGHMSEAVIPPDIAIACFRVAQESLTNVARHAAARHVWIELDQSESLLELVVRDDGVGFDVIPGREQAARRGRLGLLGMRERVQILGGTLEVTSERGRGTRIRATFPLNEVREEPPEASE